MDKIDRQVVNQSVGEADPHNHSDRQVDSFVHLRDDHRSRRIFPWTLAKGETYRRLEEEFVLIEKKPVAEEVC